MATSGAIQATSSALLALLEDAATGHPEFGDTSFGLLTSADLQASSPDGLAVTLYLYHVNVNTSRRGAPGAVAVSGLRRPPALPLDLHYLLTAWAKDAGQQQRLLGWAVRTVADTPTLPAGLLNSRSPVAAFRPDETIELIWENLGQQDVFDIWEVARPKQQPSAAYVARVVELESPLPSDQELPLVQTLDVQFDEVRP